MSATHETENILIIKIIYKCTIENNATDDDFVNRKASNFTKVFFLSICTYVWHGCQNISLTLNFHACLFWIDAMLYALARVEYTEVDFAIEHISLF